MATEQDVKSKREILSERLKARYPDKEYADDEALFGQIIDDFDEFDGERASRDERERRLVELFNKDPRSAQFLTDMAKGVDPWSSLIRRIGVEGMTDILEDPAKQEAFEEANREYMERLAKSKELDEEFERNMEASRATVASMQSELGLSDEEMDSACDMLGSIADSILRGKFSREHLELALKALRHDRDMAEAESAGEIRGRNARIEEAQVRRPSASGDGVPMLGGSNNVPSRDEPREKSIFELAAEA